MKIIDRLESLAGMDWAVLCEMYPRLVRFNPPKVYLNNRFTRTAGVCYCDTGRIELGTKFLTHSKQYQQTMYRVILPHEIIHYADFILHGKPEKLCGHGKMWTKMMLEYGLPADKYHRMDISK